MNCIVCICFLLKIGDYLSLTYVITTQSMGQILDRFRKGILILTTSVDQALYLYRRKDREVLRPWSNEDEHGEEIVCIT